jgi:2,3-bisphosphoglycerate-dependent phosphoglycerate mutase
MQLYFIRHAQSANNALWDATGGNQGRSEDPEITALGHKQAALLAQALRQEDLHAPSTTPDFQNRGGFRLTHLYTSLMLRSVMTGTLVAEALGLPLIAWKDVHENGGIYLDDPASGTQVGLPGKSRSYFMTHYPGLCLPDELGEEGWWNRPYEAVEERNQRASRFLEELLCRHGDSDDRVGVISHGAFYNRLLGELLHSSSREGLWFILNNCAITRIDFREDEVALVYANRADFLPADLIT